MKKFILAPDSFKGTMSSTKVCDIMKNAIKKHFPDANVVSIPVADGGEGTVDCFLTAVGGKKVNVLVKGPYLEDIESFYGLLPDGRTAVIEMAATAGLPLVEHRKNPALTTTYGVGQLIRHAAEYGCNNIIIAIGGSCTNDAGVGMASALGVRFLDDEGQEFLPTGGTLDRISSIDNSSRIALLDGCNLVAMCDVDNPLYGKNGAAYIYAPQKGADDDMVVLLDNNLRHLSDMIKDTYGIDASAVPGAGAAGGLGAGLVVFAGAVLKKGIETVLDEVGFDALLDGGDYVFTGEGKLDSQSIRGKVVIGVARRAKRKNVPVIAVVGDIGDDIDEIYSEGVTAVVSINRSAIPFEKARLRCESDLSLTMDTIMRFMH